MTHEANNEQLLKKKGFCDIPNIKVDKFYIEFTSTLITPDITKTECNRCFLFIVWNKITTNALSRRSQFEITFGNHALRVEPTAGTPNENIV